MKRQPHPTLFLLLFFLFSLACTPSLPSLVTEQATLAPAPTIDPNPPATSTPAASPTSAEPPATTTAVVPLPTFTPRLQPTTSATSPGNNNNNQNNNSGGVATIVPLGTGTAPAASGPLNFTYYVSWQADPADASVMIGTLTITASGGDGNYQYFRDEVSLPGPVIQYRWGKCAGNPGSLRVTSGDGQTLKIDYYENVPCN